jgi:hypothetical protein
VRGRELIFLTLGARISEKMAGCIYQKIIIVSYDKNEVVP